MKFPMRSVNSPSQALGTLGADTALIDVTKIDSSRLQGCIPRRIGYQITFSGKTAGGGNGPVYVGLSVGLTAAEVAEFFVSDPQRTNDPGSIEQSQRPVVVLEVIPVAATTNVGAVEPPRWAWMGWPGWHVIEGSSLDVFYFNDNGSAMDTGCLVDVTLQVLGDWLGD